ncbi:MAG: glycosyltransferase family A protein [Syntrophotaleaceae bacterium]
MTSISVTVLTTVYNAERFLRETVESVSVQTFQPMEHLLVDDGSTDGSLALAYKLAEEYPRIRVIPLKKNEGRPAALNVGLREAGSELIAILDSDDIAMPHWLERVVAVFQEAPEAGSVGGGGVIMTENGLITGKVKYCKKKGDVTSEVLAGHYMILHPGSVHRRSMLLKSGGYNTLLKSVEDCDMYMNVASLARLINVGEPLIYYRRLKDSESRTNPEYAALICDYIMKKAALLSSGKTISEANSSLAPIVEKMTVVPRLKKLEKGAYEYEMAKAFRQGGQPLHAFRLFLAAAVARYKPFSSCGRALGCLWCRNMQHQISLRGLEIRNTDG